MQSPFSSKFVTLLRTFSPKELDRFQEWLESPFCNRNKNLPPLLAALRRHYPGFSDAEFGKEQLFRQVLPEGKYSNRRMNNLLSEGFLAGKAFIAFRRFQQTERWQREGWLSELRDRAMDKLYFKEALQKKEQLQQTGTKSREDELALYWLQRDLYHHPSHYYRTQYGEQPILEMGEQLDLLYLLEKGAVLAEKISRNRLIKGAQHEVDKELEAWIMLSQNNSHPAVRLYRLRFVEMRQLNLEGYRTLSQAFLQCFSSLNRREQQLQLMYLLNDTATFVRQGQLGITNLLPLYKIGLNNGLLLPGGRLSYATFISVVVASNTQQSFDFTESFITQYGQQLQPSLRADCLQWAKAHMAFYKGALQECLEYLKERAFEQIQLQFISRLLQAQAYFELFLSDASYEAYLHNYLSAFEKWASRNKYYSEAYTQSIVRFTQKCRQLAILADYQHQDKKKLETLLDEEHNIQALDWLRKKQQQLLSAAPSTRGKSH